MSGYKEHKPNIASFQVQRPSLPSATTHSSTITGEGRCSYLEVARGAPAPTSMAVYPGDPRARLASDSVFITAMGDIKRCHDALVGRAAVCWLQGNSHDSQTYHVANAPVLSTMWRSTLVAGSVQGPTTCGRGVWIPARSPRRSGSPSLIPMLSSRRWTSSSPSSKFIMMSQLVSSMG